MKITCVILFLLMVVLTNAQTANNSDSPFLGWNSYDSYSVYIREDEVADNLEAFAQKIQPFGYDYFVIDMGWYAEYSLLEGTMYAKEGVAHDLNIDEFGRLEPSKVYFPHGLRPLINRAHELGIKFGVHMMRGIPRKAVALNTRVLGTDYRASDIVDTTSICSWSPYFYGVDMNKPGAQEYYNSVYSKLANWGIDFVKVDDLIPYPKEISGIAAAIKGSGREMIYSLSPGVTTNLKDLAYYNSANMLRTTQDIWDNQESIDRGFEAMRIWQGIGHPGFWTDLDMIPFGELLLTKPVEYNLPLMGKGKHRWCLFSKPQMRTFITQRAITASPLFIGGALTTIDDYSLELITNPDMLACNQNGVSGSLFREDRGLEYWGVSVNDIQTKGWVAVFNRSNENQTVKISKESLGIVLQIKDHRRSKVVPIKGEFSIKDIWTKKTHLLKTDSDVIDENIAPNDVFFIFYEELN